MGVLTAAKTHRELFSDFYANLMREPLEKTLAENPRPFWSVALFGQMMRDLSQCNGHSDSVEQVFFSSDSSRKSRILLHRRGTALTVPKTS